MTRYLAVSGGADSSAMALLLHERGEDFEMVFSDTGAEIPETYFILPRLARYVGKPLTVVSNGSFFQHLSNFGYLLPSPQRRWCTRLLKLTPQHRFLVSEQAESVSVGIRADERSRLKTMVAHKEYASQYPLIEAGIGKADALALCRKHDLLSPAYEWRSSTSCFPCFFQTPFDWKHMAERHPTLFALAEYWETASSTTQRPYTWVEGKSLRQLREATERQLEFWPDPPEGACSICQW